MKSLRVVRGAVMLFFVMQCLAVEYPFSTINIPGQYDLYANVLNQITISVSNVTLDLHGNTVSGGIHGIVVDGGLTNVTIRNGSINDVSADGIHIGGGCRDITLEDLTIKRALCGVYFDNVSNGIVSNCELSLNTTGLELSHCENIVVEQCVASCNTHAGYCLISSTTNTFEDCKAFSTGEGNAAIANSAIFGFVSTDGQGNVFERCIANSTQGLTVTGADSIVAGFALRGSEIYSKIVDSEAANATTSPTGITIPYGIVLEATFEHESTYTQHFLKRSLLASQLDWSSDGKYIATVGGNTFPNIFILTYNYVSQKFFRLTELNAGISLNSCAWSPDNSILAVSGGLLTGFFALYEFNTINNILTQLQQTTFAGVSNTVAWKNDGRFIAVGTTSSDTAQLRLFEYDAIAKNALLRKSFIIGDPNTVKSVAWFEDYLLVASESSASNIIIRLYRLDSNIKSLTLLQQITSASGASSPSVVAWSPSGSFFAFDDSSSNTVRIFSFNNETAAISELEDYTPLGAVFDLNWVTDSLFAIGSVGPNVEVVEFFKGATPRLIDSSDAGATGNPVSVQWSPDGSIIAVLFNRNEGVEEASVIALSGLQFPQNNVIKNNTIYANSGNDLPGGIGIFGSSILNAIIQNTSYNNPLNYLCVANVYNQLFGDAPTDLQNISIKGCEAICMPQSLNTTLKQILYKLCDPIQTSLDIIFSELDTISNLCSPTPILSPTTISVSGSYCLGNAINGSITIAASDVVLDLNNYNITDGLVINGGYNQISVENGAIEAGSSDDAIQAQSGSSNIQLTNIQIKNGIHGINFESITGGLIKNCEMTQNTTGLELTGCSNIVVRDCVASCNSHVGYSLMRSSTNCFDNCKALSTGEGNFNVASTTIFGFVSDSGYGNIFERCIANATQGLTVTGARSVIAGIALRGSENSSKIIDCEAANSISSSIGSTNPYGILLEGVVDPITTLTGAMGTNGTVNTVGWSSDGKYVAVGGQLVGGSTDVLQIYTYNYHSKNLQLVESLISEPAGPINPSVQAVEWSPNGLYLAAVGNQLDPSNNSADFRIYKFDRETEQATLIYKGVSSITGSIYDVSWRYDNNYIAISGDELFSDKGESEMQIFSFNTASEMVTTITGVFGGIGSTGGNVNAVDWHPEGVYLATGGDSIADFGGNQLNIFQFNQNTDSIISVTGQFATGLGSNVQDVAWSPNGTYLAVVGGGLTAGTGHNIQIFSFNQTTGFLTAIAGFPSGLTHSVAWSSDGRYIVTGGGSSVNSRILLFDAGAGTLTELKTVFNAEDIFDAQWSPDGSVIGFAGTGFSQNYFTITTGLTFPLKNIVKHNTVYCNSGNSSPGGFGISGSSIVNMIIQNTSYNNPQNYAYIPNVFNQIFETAPTDLQNISVKGCAAICAQEDLNLVLEQALYKLCHPVSSQLDVIQLDIINALIDICGIESQLAVIESKISQLSTNNQCSPTPIFAPTTISTSGFYCLANQIDGSIIIDASDVTLDLNNYKITNGLTINPNVDQISIENGTIEAVGTDAVSVGSGVSHITLSDIQIKNGIRGISMENVVDGLIQNCELTMNTTGLELTNSYKIVVKNCTASCNTHAGYSLISSTTNCFEDCKALSTGEANGDIEGTTILGFVSDDGHGNIFERCIANSTQGLTVTGSNSLIAGFALRGSERCSKIIDSESANSMSNFQGACTPYGITLENTVSDFISSITGALYGNSLISSSVQWSPDGKYILYTGQNNGAYIISFDRLGNTTAQVANVSSDDIRAGTWYPTGAYFALGNSTGSNRLQVYAFDWTTLQVNEVASLDIVSTPSFLDWSQDGRFIAITRNDFGSNDNLIVIDFDATTCLLSTVTGALNAGALDSSSWSPDGKYIAVGGTGITGGLGFSFQVFEFSSGAQSLIPVAGAGTANVNAVTWSPNGNYIALYRAGGVGAIEIYSFNEDTNTVSLIAQLSESFVFQLAWSDDSKYLVGTTALTGRKVALYRFDPGARTIERIREVGDSNSSVYTAWSPDGKYIATGFNTTSVIDNSLKIYQALSGPEKNVITNNTIYCNSGDVYQEGFGISGNSVSNMIIQNTSYNNPQNYAFVTNVFNQQFGSAPTDLQNIALVGCAPICTSENLGLILQQAKYKVCEVLPSQIDAIAHSVINILIQDCVIASEVDVVESKVDQLIGISGCGKTPISEPTTITASGIYCCANDIDGAIIIDASDVLLDINNYTILGGIVVNNSLNQITITNGTVEGGSTTNAIEVDSGVTNIEISDVILKNSIVGLNVTNVSGALVDRCEMSLNTTGALFNNAHDITVKNCIALCNTHAGFDLISSTTNCFEDCKALSTGEGNTDLRTNIFGFVSSSGYGNIFERCIANSTQGLTVTGGFSVITGFALRGSEHSTKIINSESANSVSSSSGVTVPYGILIEGSYESTSNITGFMGTNGFSDGVAWSPDGKFVAVVGSGLTGGTGTNLQIYQYDYAGLSLMPMDGVLSGTVTDVVWSPDAAYLAVVGNGITGGSGNQFQVFEFDSEQGMLYSIAGSLSGSLNSVDWSSDGRYIAVGGSTVTGGTGNKLQVFYFDRVANSLSALTGIFTSGTVSSVSWSFDGAYIAAGGSSISGGTGNQCQVIAFDAAYNTLTAVAGILDGSVLTVDWSYDAKYIVAGGTTITAGTGNQLQVLSFDSTAHTLSAQAGFLTGTVNSARWSGDGRYIVIGGSSLVGGSGNQLQVALFDRGSRTLISKQGQLIGSVNDAQWSPDGSVIAVAGSALGLSDEFLIMRGLNFPQKNVITNNIVYCNQTSGVGGFGISGSSIANLINTNASYNNSYNYVYVTNVFNQLFGSAPSGLQNIGLEGCVPICQPENPNLYLEQAFYKICNPIPSLIDVLISKVDVLGSSGECNPTSITSANIVSGRISLSTPGNYCLAEDVVADIAITTSCVTLDLNNRCVIGTLGITVGEDILVSNGFISAPAPTVSIIAPDAVITVTNTAVNTQLSYIIVRATDSTTTNVQGRNGIDAFGPRTKIMNCTIISGAAANSSSGNASRGGDGIRLGPNGSDMIVKNCVITSGNGGTTTAISGNGGAAGYGIHVATGNSNAEISFNTIMKTGAGGAGGASGIGGAGGTGIFIESGAIDTSAFNNTIKNTGAGGSGGTAGAGGKAVEDNVTSAANLSMIYSNFAHNISNTIKYDIQDEGVESGVLTPNPPTSTVINPLANVYADNS